MGCKAAELSNSMSRITSKPHQVTAPKATAQRYGIRSGDGIRFEESGESIRMAPDNVRAPAGEPDLKERLRLFDAVTARQQHARIRTAGASLRRPALGYGGSCSDALGPPDDVPRMPAALLRAHFVRCFRVIRETRPGLE